MVPLEAAAPVLTDVRPSSDEMNNEKMVEAQEDQDQDNDLPARRRRDSDLDDFVFENGTSSDGDDDDDDDDDDYADCDENENRKSHLQLVWDSDSSDDFCIIDPENAALIPEGFELLPDSRSWAATLTQSQTVTCDSDVPSPNSSPAPSYEEVMSASQISHAKASEGDERVADKVVHPAPQPEHTEDTATGGQEMTRLVLQSNEETPEGSLVESGAANVEIERAQPLAASSLPETTPMVPLTTSSLPQSTPIVPLTATSLSETTPMVPLTASSIPQSTPMVPLTASLPESTPMVPLTTSSVPESTPMVPLTAASLPETTPMVPLTAPAATTAVTEKPDQEVLAGASASAMPGDDGSSEEKVPEVTMNTDEDSGLIHTMSESEKNKLLELLRKEMGREFILEARRAEAEFRNRELELIGQQAERIQEARMEEVHSSSTASLAGSTRSRSLSRTTSESSSIGPAPGNVSSEREGKFSRSSSVASSSTRDADCQTVPTSYGLEQPSASHIIHNVATEVSKVATTAFYTAKDVFHALQAKQSDWKAPSSSYKPPQSKWKPPADTYRPPAKTYKPKESTYKPPEDTYKPPRDYDDYSDYTPPRSNWTPPQSTFIPPNIIWTVGGERVDVGRRNEVQISKAPSGSVDIPSGEEATPEAGGEQDVAGATPTVTVAERSSSVDEGLESERSQRDGMKRLVEMGFANRAENKRLLAQFKLDLSKVIQALLEEQANDQWAQNRH
ncbi:hypothetical protein ElyMa_001252900 [Elysia marginata]|uniref:UBA domain-containing protein n=1 Tax=Elysia marginata TaxID=1093978 RepID=A0AAV4IAW0_9GAST|nr:hypothetical protein ElyMa_001252900 [Elysia marginata]